MLAKKHVTGQDAKVANAQWHEQTSHPQDQMPSFAPSFAIQWSLGGWNGAKLHVMDNYAIIARHHATDEGTADTLSVFFKLLCHFRWALKFWKIFKQISWLESLKKTFHSSAQAYIGCGVAAKQHIRTMSKVNNTVLSDTDLLQARCTLLHTCPDLPSFLALAHRCTSSSPVASWSSSGHGYHYQLGEQWREWLHNK